MDDGAITPPDGAAPASRKRAAPRRAQYHHGDLPQALKALAVQMIAAQGAEGFSMRDAAARLGVAPSAVYRHFADKSELFSAVSREGFADLGRLWHRLMAEYEARVGDDPALVALARFSAGADAYLMFARQNPALFQLMHGKFGTAVFGLAQMKVPDENNPFTILSAALDGLLNTGLITAEARPNAEIKAHAAVHGLACLAVSGVFKDCDEAYILAQLDYVKEVVLAGLMAGPKQCWWTNPMFAHLPPMSVLL